MPGHARLDAPEKKWGPGLVSRLFKEMPATADNMV